MTDAAPTKLEQTKKLVAAHKGRIAVALASGEDTSPSDLLAVVKLEAQIENAEALERLQKLTADPPVRRRRRRK